MSEDQLKYPDFSRYLQRAIRRLNRDGMIPFSDLELVVVGHISSLETEPNDALGDRICYEVDELGLPKLVALVTWLNPFGMVSHHPKLILRLARYLLGETRDEEESQLPQELRATMGV